MSRHDYLPFGEELFAGTGNRTTAQGYSFGDNTRQKFTLKERDSETGLDWFETRYFSSTQGRFTSADSFFGRTASPQTLNLYSYVRNNPLKYVDPYGHQDQLPKKKGKKGQHDEEFGNTPDTPQIVVTNSVPANPLPGPVPQPHPTPTPTAPSRSSGPSWFMTRQEMEQERRAYYQNSQADGIAYDISHNPVLLFLLGTSIRTPEEPPITREVLEETGVILEESSLAVQTSESATILEGNAGHIFRDAIGHLSDTAGNRQLLIETASSTKNLLGTDKFGNAWFAKTLPSGKQVWASVRGGVIRNGGLNETPRVFNANTGLSGGPR